MGKLAREINALAHESNAKFISFKFIDSSGQLQQIDSLISNLQFKDDTVLIHDLTLIPIANKFFLDPFRSFPTIFCLCENLAYSTRTYFSENLEIEHQQGSILECSLEFTALNKNNNSMDGNDHGSCNFAVEPQDALANLRTEVVLACENAGIDTCYHYATGSVKSVVGFKARDFLELADNYIIAKYIIANTAESYGKSAEFMYSSNNNQVINSVNKESFQKFTNTVIQEYSASIKSAMPKFSSNYDSLNNRLVINFDNSKINPYQTFSFFNLNNYKTDIIAKEFLNKMIIK